MTDRHETVTVTADGNHGNSPTPSTCVQSKDAAVVSPTSRKLHFSTDLFEVKESEKTGFVLVDQDKYW